MSDNKIILLGGGGHCKAVIDIIEQEGKFKIFGILDLKENIGKKILGYEIIGTDEDLKFLKKDIRNAIITVGHIHTNELRVRLYNYLKSLGYNLPNVISPLAYVSKYAILGEGNVIMHHSLVNTGARIGNNCIINTKALIEHDAIVEDHCHISTGAIVNGGVIVRQGTFFGSNATSKEYVEVVGFVKAGSVVK